MSFPTVVPNFVDTVMDPNYFLNPVFSSLYVIFPILAANLSGHSLNELITQCTQKSSNWNQVWEEFEEIFGKKILRYLYHEFRKYSGGYYDIEYDETLKDLRQDIYIKLLRDDGNALKNFKGKTENSFLAYLHVISKHVVINFFKGNYERKVKRFPGVEEFPSNTELKNQRGEPLSYETVDKMDKQFLRDFIVSQLKDSYNGRDFERDLLVFKLFYFEGHTAKQIINTYNVNLSTQGVASLVNRMKKKLQKIIKK